MCWKLLCLLRRMSAPSRKQSEDDVTNILIFGVTGMTGGAVAEAALGCAWFRVNGFTRTMQGEAYDELVSKGVTLHTGDMTKPLTIKGAKENIDTVFLHTTYWETMSVDIEYQQGFNVVNAAMQSKVKHLIYIGAEYSSLTAKERCKYFEGKAMVENYIVNAGDVGFDEWEILHEDGHLDDGLYKPSDMYVPKDDQPHSPADKEKPMDIDSPPPVVGDGFGDEFMDADDGCDEDDDDTFGDIDQDFFAQNFMGTGGLFEDPPAMSNVNATNDASEAASASPKRDDKKSLGGETDAEETVPLQAAAAGVSAVSSTMGEQTTRVEHLDTVPEKRRKVGRESLPPGKIQIFCWLLAFYFLIGSAFAEKEYTHVCRYDGKVDVCIPIEPSEKERLKETVTSSAFAEEKYTHVCRYDGKVDVCIPIEPSEKETTILRIVDILDGPTTGTERI
ncbi:uncharacterized protein LOC131952427 [Physella acuta]|uniref:uncharacterized protein LOC131952427 n=1 Tax=Physella acuta TaxID=109671 RepID=UPI0027DB9F3E|nr:uncharacterized protein LOC131952427 [Physella acuta]